MRATPENYFTRREEAVYQDQVQKPNYVYSPYQEGQIEIIPPWVPILIGLSLVGAFVVAIYAISKVK